MGVLLTNAEVACAAHWITVGVAAGAFLLCMWFLWLLGRGPR